MPEYFRKKKENQKRRRQEKHELIKKHKKELEKIFGDAVFQSGWPISRKEIKLALGIYEEDEVKVGETMTEFSKIVQQMEV